jgi:hypothetical protein
VVGRSLCLRKLESESRARPVRESLCTVCSRFISDSGRNSDMWGMAPRIKLEGNYGGGGDPPSAVKIGTKNEESFLLLMS